MHNTAMPRIRTRMLAMSASCEMTFLQSPALGWFQYMIKDLLIHSFGGAGRMLPPDHHKFDC
jgi:hypothetical protein